MLFSPHAADPCMTDEELRERMRPLLGENGVHLSPFLSRRSLLRGQGMGQSPAGDDFFFASGALRASSILPKCKELICLALPASFSLIKAAAAFEARHAVSVCCNNPPAGLTSRM